MEYPCVLHIVYVAKYFRVIGLTLVVLAAGGGGILPPSPLWHCSTGNEILRFYYHAQVYEIAI